MVQHATLDDGVVTALSLSPSVNHLGLGFLLAPVFFLLHGFLLDFIHLLALTLFVLQQTREFHCRFLGIQLFQVLKRLNGGLRRQLFERFLAL